MEDKPHLQAVAQQVSYSGPLPTASEFTQYEISLPEQNANLWFYGVWTNAFQSSLFRLSPEYIVISGNGVVSVYDDEKTAS